MASLTDAQKRAIKKWNKNNLDRIQIIVRKGEKEKIKEAAESSQESLNSYIVSAIYEKMQKNRG